ncbi:High mobility group B protein 7 [Apostasia shenzhenica]|uniref:High mobility group B protein 7 n=1 Tax=Apostasia shenzhenica TaxID=1088818 RepID=A0A2H9ZXQ0_9ASPA|nr:High mobility group B protein 7 [Apostasia shenzhenica]
MAGGSSKSNLSRARKRVEEETTSMKRAKDGSAFTKCDECQQNVPVRLIDMYDCSMDSKIRMNLESQVVERVTEIKKPERKKASSSTQSERKPKKEKRRTAPKKRKRPPTAFFLFMDDFRREYKEANPDNKNVAAVAKEGGEKWKAMTDEERKVYRDKAAELKAKYEKAEANDDECEKEDVNGEAEAKEEEGNEVSDNDEE